MGASTNTIKNLVPKFERVPLSLGTHLLWIGSMTLLDRLHARAKRVVEE
jgi:hypothetical protein